MPGLPLLRVEEVQIGDVKLVLKESEIAVPMLTMPF
jgi:hypothetical protein